MGTDDDARPLGGRRRDPAIDKAIARAALALVAERGIRGLSLERVAKHAGVAVTTVYRRFSSIEELLLTLLNRTYQTITAPQTGDLRADLLATVRAAFRAWSAPEQRRYLAALITAHDADEEPAAALRPRFDPDRSLFAGIMERALTEGQVHADADPDVVRDLIAGLIVQRVLFRRTPLTDTLAEQVVDLILNGIRAPVPPAADPTVHSGP